MVSAGIPAGRGRSGFANAARRFALAFDITLAIRTEIAAREFSGKNDPPEHDREK